MATMPKPYPREFRENVVAVARQGREGIAQIAKDFGIAESCLRNWLSAADAEDGKRGGPKAQQSEQLRELKRARFDELAGTLDSVAAPTTVVWNHECNDSTPLRCLVVTPSPRRANHCDEARTSQRDGVGRSLR